MNRLKLVMLGGLIALVLNLIAISIFDAEALTATELALVALIGAWCGDEENKKSEGK